MSHEENRAIVEAIRKAPYPLKFKLARWSPLLVILAGSGLVVLTKAPWPWFAAALAVGALAYAVIQTWHKRLFVARAVELGYERTKAERAFDHFGEFAG